MRATVRFSFGTQAAPAASVTSSGWPPTWMRATTAFVAGSTLTTSPCPNTATQTAVEVAVTSACSIPTSMRALTRLVAGSIRYRY